MKKCASCTKDLPDAALHCVFCGAKQPPAPAVQQGMAKTAFGYSANDVADHMRQQGRPLPPPPPAYQPTQQQPPYQPPRPVAPAMAPPRPAPPMSPPMSPPMPPYAGAPPPPGGFVPMSPAGAPTMFAPGPAQPLPPQPSTLQSPGYGRPNPGPGMLPPTLVPPPQQLQPQLPPMPMMRIPAAQPPPYPASQSASRGTRPIEPWRDHLRLMMFLWGVALLVAFAMPLQTSPDVLFNWKLVLDAPGTAKIPLLMIAAVGLLSVIVAAIPMASVARGMIAALLGLAGVFVPIALVGLPPWRLLSTLIGMLLLVPSLLVRNEYRGAMLPRILVTLGAIGILAPFLVPEGGAIPLVAMIKQVIDTQGDARILAALEPGLIAVVVLSLLAWLPAPATGGAKLWAWLVIGWGLIMHVTGLVLRGNIPDAITKAPNETLVAWVASGAAGAGAAYLVLVGYGLATVVGKQLE